MYARQNVVLFRMKLRSRFLGYDMGLPCLFTASAFFMKQLGVTFQKTLIINHYSHLQGSIKYSTEFFMTTNRATVTEKRNANLNLKSVVTI
jgi:hypothetical protein